MKNIKGKYMHSDGKVSKYNSNFCSAVDEVKVDDIVVVRGSYGLSFVIVTVVEDTVADTNRPKALCVVPNEEEIIF